MFREPLAKTMTLRPAPCTLNPKPYTPDSLSLSLSLSHTHTHTHSLSLFLFLSQERGVPRATGEDVDAATARRLREHPQSS